MTEAPTMSDLALFAHRRLGEDPRPLVESRLSCLDVVVEAYARPAGEPTDTISETASRDLEDHLQRQGEHVTAPKRDVDEFVGHALTFLETQYPRRTEARRERDVLRTLYWGHLVEARFAAE